MHREEESMIKNVFTIALMLALVAGFYYSFAHAAEPVGYVTSLKGEVYVIHAGEQVKNTLELNDPVYPGDTIQTVTGSRIQILMEDDTMLNLGERAQITIKEHLYRPEKDLRSSVYKLIRGKVRVVVGKLFCDPASRLDMETPTSIIGIRMTEFVVWVVSPELTVVITLDGKVIAKNIRPDLVCIETVTEGYQSQIAKDACPTAPTKTPTEKMEEILLETEAYMPPPAKEMDSSTASLKESVKNVLSTAPATILAPVASILGTGMMGTATSLQGVTALAYFSAEAANLQLLTIQPGEVTSTFTLPPVIPPLPPISPVLIVPFLLPLPEPPPPPH